MIGRRIPRGMSARPIAVSFLLVAVLFLSGLAFCIGGDVDASPPDIASSPPEYGTIGMEWKYLVEMIDFGTYTMHLISGPAGSAQDGMWLTWTPTVPGVFPWELSVVSSELGTSYQFWNVTVEVGTPASITSSPPTAGTVGGPWQYEQIGSDVFEWHLISGPTGASLAAAPYDSVIYWTPTAPGTFAFETSTLSTTGFTSYEFWNVTVGPSLITSTPPISATIGVQYEYKVFATSGVEFVAECPPGANRSFNTIRWTPTAVGVYQFSVQAYVIASPEQITYQFWNVTAGLPVDGGPTTHGTDPSGTVSKSPIPGAATSRTAWIVAGLIAISLLVVAFLIMGHMTNRRK